MRKIANLGRDKSPFHETDDYLMKQLVNDSLGVVYAITNRN